MDGLLIDSEPLWQRAEIDIFGALGLELTEKMCEKLQGTKIDELVKYWFSFKPWKGKTLKEVENQLLIHVEMLIENEVVLMPGVDYILNFFEQKGLHIGLASSSNLSLIEKALKKTGIFDRIPMLHSSQFEKAGKPRPDVYLTAAKKLNSFPHECLVFEDSYNGLVAGKKAGMKVVAIPSNRNRFDRRFSIADLKISTLEKFTHEHFTQLNK